MAFARKSRCVVGTSSESRTATSAGNAIELDKRAQLKDRPCSPDDEELEYDGADEGSEAD